MEIWQKAVLIGLGLGIVLTYWIAPRSIQKDAVRGGAMAQLFHLLGVVLLSSVVPTVLVSIILHGGFGTAFPLAISMMASAFVLLIVYAIFEQPARTKAQPEDEVWTAEKAKSSGL